MNEFFRSIEKDTGLPMNLIQEILVLAMSFYLQNKEKVEIKRGQDGKIQYFLIDSDLINQYSRFVDSRLIKKYAKEFVLDEKEMNTFLFAIDFRGAKIDAEYKIDGIPSSRFI